MPSARHDSLSQMFTGEPSLVGTVLRECAGADLPAGLPARLEQARFNDRLSADFDADVVVVHGPVREPVHGAIVEVQLNRSEEKRQQLARYATGLWLMIRCPVDVLVICSDRATADFYRPPVRTSMPGYVLTPRVVGPAQVPAITDPVSVAESPGLAVLSVAMHGQQPGVCEAFMAGIDSLPPDRGPAYYETAHAACRTAVRSVLEDLVSQTTWLVSSPFAKEHFGRGKAEGRAEGEADALLLMLEARGLEVTPADRGRISACTDLEQLRTWVIRAASATSVSELFG